MNVKTKLNRCDTCILLHNNIHYYARVDEISILVKDSIKIEYQISIYNSKADMLSTSNESISSIWVEESELDNTLFINTVHMLKSLIALDLDTNDDVIAITVNGVTQLESLHLESLQLESTDGGADIIDNVVPKACVKNSSDSEVMITNDNDT